MYDVGGNWKLFKKKKPCFRKHRIKFNGSFTYTIKGIYKIIIRRHTYL